MRCSTCKRYRRIGVVGDGQAKGYCLRGITYYPCVKDPENCKYYIPRKKMRPGNEKK